jgi:potassium voltage-gated channel Eag-related subfamily H protein 8
MLKLDKDRSLLTSYRSISLSSYVCRTMERMVNHWHLWMLESRNLPSSSQCGLRRCKSTLDPLVSLEYNVQNTLSCADSLMRSSLTWRKRTIRLVDSVSWEPNTMESERSATLFIASFLMDRGFCVHLGNVCSSRYVQENRMPQGSVLCVTLISPNYLSLTLSTTREFVLPLALSVRRLESLYAESR